MKTTCICCNCKTRFSFNGLKARASCPLCGSGQCKVRTIDINYSGENEKVTRFSCLESLEGKIPTLNEHPDARTEGAFFAAEYFLHLAEKFGVDIAKAELKTEQAKENLRQRREKWKENQQEVTGKN